MMRFHQASIIILPALIAGARTAPAADVIEPELLFQASFDRLTANADLAQGNPESTLTESLELRARPGVIGHCLILEDDEQCRYEVKDNLDMSAGTVSFWVKPANWTGADRRYEMFWRVADSGFRLYVDKDDKEEVVRFYCAFGTRGEPDFRQYFVLGQAHWDTETWHKIDATWDATHMALYVDGAFSNRVELPDVQMPSMEGSRFWLVPIHRDNPPTHSSADRTYIDEFEIYRGVLTEERILARYIAQHAAMAGDVPPPMARVPRRTGEITIDGSLDDEGWQRASEVPILTDIRSTFPHSRQARGSLCWDDERLYIGLWSEKQEGELKADAAERDGPAWEDDSFEVFLSPGEEPSDDFAHFIFNAAGTIFDSRGPVTDYTAGVEIATSKGEREWMAEVAVPFADLGVAGPAPEQVLRANLCRDWPQEPPAQPTYTAWAYTGPSFTRNPERFGRFVLGGEGEGTRAGVGPGLSAGALSVAATAFEPATLNVSVTAERARVLDETRALDGEETVSASLRDVRNGVLAVSITAADGTGLLDYRTRFMVREPIAVEYLPRVLDEMLGLQIDLRNLESTWAEAVRAGGATLRIDVAGPEGYAASSEHAVDGLGLTAEVPLEYRDGSYEFTYTLTAPGMAEPLVASSELEKPPTPWLGAGVGITDEVLEPWTPLEYRDDGAVACWNREYRFEGPLPSAITAGGEAVLRGPITLTMRTPDGEGELRETSAEVVRADPSRMERSGQARFSDLQVPVRWEAWMEYDGLAVGSLTIDVPEGGLSIEELTVRIPLRPEIVRYIRGERKSPNRTQWDGELWESHFQPYIWVHDETEGFCYFCEEEANWVYGDDAPVVRVIGGDDAAIELRIISEPVTAREPLTYQLGFQATPVRPPVPDWRAWNFGSYRPAEGQNAHVYMAAYHQWAGLFMPGNIEQLLKHEAERDEMGVRTFYYATTSCTPNNNPTYDLFGSLWHCSYPSQYGPYDGERNSPTWREPTPDYYLMPVCNGCETLADYQVYWARELLEIVGPEGLYTDCDGMWACENRAHGHGFTDQFGKSGVTYPVLEHRALAKRLATVVRHARGEGGRRAYWMTHCHSKMVVPIHGFADFFYPGEQYTHQLYGNHWFYVDDLDETAWRAQLSSYPSGVAHIFLPEFVRGTKQPEDREHPEYTESLLAMCATGDVNCSGNYCNLEAMAEWWAVRERTGIVDAQFVGYWRDDCPVRALTERALASAYLRDDAVVIPVTNRLPDAAEVRVDVSGLGLDADATAVDLRTGEALAIEGGEMTVPVGGRNYTYVTVER